MNNRQRCIWVHFSSNSGDTCQAHGMIYLVASTSATTSKVDDEIPKRSNIQAFITDWLSSVKGTSAVRRVVDVDPYNFL